MDHPRLTPAIAPETIVTTSIEMQVLNEVGAVRQAVRDMNFRLFGDATVENHAGRLPMLESDVRVLKLRVSKLERYVWIATGIGIAIGWVLHLIGK